MKCANHPTTDSVAFCGQCGRPLCGECKHEVRGMTYCETCLAARVSAPGLAAILGPGTGPSPGVALALGFIPGVGAIYNGQVIKAMVQVLIFGSLIALSERALGGLGKIFGLGAFAFYFYMVIDSFQTARRKQLGQPAEEWFGLGDFRLTAPLGAALLIALGALFLLDNLGLPVFHQLGRLWPVLLILVGVVMLYQRAVRPAPPPRPPEPPAPTEGPSNIPGPLGL